MWCGERDSKCEEMIRRIEKMDSAAGLTKWIFLCLCLSRCAYACRILEEPRIYFLNAGDSVQNSNPGLKIYCHNATSKYLIWKMWSTMTMHLNISSDSYILYEGQTPDEIHQKYDEKNDQLLNLNLFDTRKQFQINPFKNVCIGVYVDSPSKSGYIITLRETDIVWRLTMILMGIIFLCYAKKLSRNWVFYPVCDIIFGVPAIISIYIAKKLIPRGSTIWVKLTASVILGLSLLIIASTLWENMQLSEWLMYIVVTFLISCTIFDNFGPVPNAKIRQRIQLFLQLVGLVLVFWSSHFLAVLLCCVALIYYYFPRAAFQRGNRYCMKRAFQKEYNTLSIRKVRV